MKSDFIPQTDGMTDLGLLRKKFPKDRNIHRPLHLFLPQRTYFVSSRTLNKKCFLFDDKRKDIFYKILREAIKEIEVKMMAWVILSNHYHLLFFSEKTDQVSRLIQILHSKSTVLLNKFDSKPGRRIWFQYRDWIIRDERDLYTHFNYIHHNPVKHSLVDCQDQVLNYKYCSYQQWVKLKGQEYMDSLFEDYPVCDFNKEI